MSWYHPSTVLDKVFEGGLVLKGMSGAAELLGGLILLLTSPVAIHGFLVVLTQKEITEDPGDRIATFLLDSTAHINAGAKAFAVAYLWLHAAIKLTAVIGILRNKTWAYPFSLIALGILTAYQMVSMVVSFSWGMLALTAFDVVILSLIWREYTTVRRPPGGAAA